MVIIRQAADYDKCLDQPLLPQLLDSELYLLLRFSLDDPVRAVVSAAVAALASLLSSTRDEVVGKFLIVYYSSEIYLT